MNTYSEPMPAMPLAPVEMVRPNERTQLEMELSAMRVCAEAFAPLDKPTRDRVFAWLESRIEQIESEEQRARVRVRARALEINGPGDDEDEEPADEDEEHDEDDEE